VDLAGWGADYVALSGYRLYAPFGVGVLAGRADWLDQAPPYWSAGRASLGLGTRLEHIERLANAVAEAALGGCGN
jgi:selenocysteine lyase/cysteine desulfurase